MLIELSSQIFPGDNPSSVGGAMYGGRSEQAGGMMSQELLQDENRLRLKMRAEAGAESPLWTANGEMVWLEDLPLQPALRRELREWNDLAWTSRDAVIQTRGQTLLSDTARQLGDGYELIWDNEWLRS